MSEEGNLKVLEPFLDVRRLRYERSLTSSVTTQWGVSWDEELIARDLMQNFFDANRSHLSQVRVAEHESHAVVVSAPTACHLERLFYLGSEKGPDDVGQYGEGFKAAAVCLLRDHRVTPIAWQGHQVLCLRLAPEPVPGTRLTPLVYDFFTTEEGCEGTQLILPGCSPRLVQALKEGLHHFFHDANPLLGSRCWGSGDRKFALYHSTDPVGHLFYRHLKRGVIPDIPLVLVIHKPYARIERQIQHDRDRNAFGGKLLVDLYQVFAQYGLRGYPAAQRTVIEAARPCWVRGHPLLSALAATAYSGEQLLDAGVVRQLFGDQYFARAESRETNQLLRYRAVERQWLDAGRQALPGYFAKFGVLSADRYLQELERQSLHQQRRAPTPAERESLGLLAALLDDFAPELWQLIATRTVTYTIARSETVLGQLKRERDYRSHDVYLAASLFEEELAEAMAVFFHEHAHICGYDGSRMFTDALTQLLASVVRQRRRLDHYEPRWQAARARVLRERQSGATPREEPSLQERLVAMREGELRQLLQRLPPLLLQELLQETREIPTDGAAAATCPARDNPEAEEEGEVPFSQGSAPASIGRDLDA